MSKARSGIAGILSARGAQRARNKIPRTHLLTGTRGALGFASAKNANLAVLKTEGKRPITDTSPQRRGSTFGIELQSGIGTTRMRTGLQLSARLLMRTGKSISGL